MLWKKERALMPQIRVVLHANTMEGLRLQDPSIASRFVSFFLV